jgi:hypothetical protein
MHPFSRLFDMHKLFRELSAFVESLRKAKKTKLRFVRRLCGVP